MNGRSPARKRARLWIFACLNKSEKETEQKRLVSLSHERRNSDIERRNSAFDRKKKLFFFARESTCLRTSEEKVCYIVTKSENINPSVNLRKLVYSPNENPYMQGVEIQTKYKTVRTRAARRDLMDPETGEVVGASIIHTIEERDEEHFVKVFAEGVELRST